MVGLGSSLLPTVASCLDWDMDHMSDRQVAWLQTVGGVLVLLVAIFLFSGIIEIAGAVLGVYLFATGLKKFRGP